MADAYTPPTAELYNEEPQDIFFALSIKKLIVLTVLTLGIYSIHWFYKNFRYVKKTYNDNSLPALRAIFSVIFCYSLFLNISIAMENQKMDSRLQAGMLASVYIVCSIIGQFAPGMFSLVSLMGALVIYWVNHKIILLNQLVNTSYLPNSTFYWYDWLIIVIGLLLWVLIVAGVFLE